MKRLHLDDRKLTINELREISADLPKPDFFLEIGKTKFKVFRVKKFFSPDWPNPVLRRLVVEARKTYQEYYGDDMHELDLYDNKSAVYLLSSEYNLQNQSLREWFSLRFIPASGKPDMNEDLNFYIYDDKQRKVPILKILKEKIQSFSTLTEEKMKQKIITISRFCAIRPYSVTGNLRRLEGNLHTAISFALINQVFLDDLKSETNGFNFITCQLHEFMSDELLTYTVSGQKLNLAFTTAHAQLDLLAEYIKIARNKKNVYAYQIPGYFLNLRNIVDFLRSLISQNQISAEIIKKYLAHGVNLELLLAKPEIQHFRNLGKLFTKKGLIDGTKMTGEKLRSLLDQYVKDGPVLRIIEIKLWTKSVYNLIKFAQNHG